MADPLSEELRATVREAVGLDPDSHLPAIDRLAFYEAEVLSASSDGKTLDLRPLDARIERMQGVELRRGVPASTAVVSPGAVVLIGWERGDPTRPFAEPSWKGGATVQKLIFEAVALYLGGESGAKLLALHGDTVNRNTALTTWMSSVEGFINGIATGTVTPLTGAAIGTVSSSATIARGK